MAVDKAAGRRMQKVRKSDRTRAAILGAAQKLFAEHGHERTTVREIAAKASVDPALVIRYFGSKDELFVRAAAFDLKVPDLDKINRSQIGETLIRRFLELGEGFTGMTVLLRSAASNEYAAGRIRKLLAAQVVPAFARVGNRATARERAALVTSQLLGLALCRYILKIHRSLKCPKKRSSNTSHPRSSATPAGRRRKRFANKPLKKCAYSESVPSVRIPLPPPVASHQTFSAGSPAREKLQ